MADASNYRIRLVVSPPLGALVSIAACDLTWHHAAFTYSPASSPSSLSAFFDGELVQRLNANVSLAAATASTLRVGWSGDLSAASGVVFSGALAELRIYNGTLSPAEVAALSQPPLGAYPFTVVVPSFPDPGSRLYAFTCAVNSSGRGGSLVRNVSGDGGWAWSACVEPHCVSMPPPPGPSAQPAVSVGPTTSAQPAAIGSSGSVPLSSGATAGIAVLAILLALAAVFVGLTRLRMRRQIVQLTSKTTQASRALDRARLLALQATPNAPEFAIELELGTVMTVQELQGELRSPMPSVNPLVRQSSLVMALRRGESLTTSAGSSTRDSLAETEPERKERITEIKWSELVPDLSIRPKFGGFGAIFVARWTLRRKTVAVKLLKSAVLTYVQSITDVEMLLHEAHRLLQASHGGANVNVVQCFGVAQGVAEGWQGAPRLARAVDGQRERRRHVRSLAALSASLSVDSGASISSDPRNRSAAECISDDEGDVCVPEAPTDSVACAGAELSVGANAGPAPYLIGLVMSFVSGGSLNETLFPRRGVSWPTTMLDRLRVLKEIATCLYQLHATGLVHGDLKLENVLLGDERHVRLADFGLATLRATAGRATRMSTVVEAKTTRGTFTYMVRGALSRCQALRTEH